MAPRKQNTENAGAEGETKPKRAPQRRRFWFFYSLRDANGNKVSIPEGCTLTIDNLVTNVNEAMEIVDADRSVQYVKHEITAKQDEDAAAA